MFVVEDMGNLILCLYFIVNFIIYDFEIKWVIGVRIIDGEMKEIKEFYVKIIFCCVFVFGSIFILMNLILDCFLNGLGNDSGELGYNLMDYYFCFGVRGWFDGFGDKYYKGCWLNGIYIFCFCNIDKVSIMKDYVCGYGY